MSSNQGIPGYELVEDIRRLADEYGRPPTAREYDENGRYSRSPIRRRFGSWNEALRSSGVGVGKEWDISEERLLHDLRRVADELGETPSYREYDDLGEFNTSTYQERFGKWENAIHEAALEVKGVHGPRPEAAYLTPEDLGLSPIDARSGD